MTKGFNYFFILTLIWLSFVLAISFFEAPLKFTAEGVIYEQALRIGKKIFLSLNRLELVFASLTFCYFIYTKNYRSLWIGLIPIFIVLLQTFWIMPPLLNQMDERINQIPLKSHFYHITYIIMELIKVISLAIFTYLQIKNFKNEARYSE
ncbi:hypothetical protein UJ101_01837 [Flavobacteriaceae bacterium UJ101]|nr:hypothetical protein UJ101_01837 [Flavobacteriaceae bacterium UJ101]